MTLKTTGGPVGQYVSQCSQMVQVEESYLANRKMNGHSLLKGRTEEYRV